MTESEPAYIYRDDQNFLDKFDSIKADVLSDDAERLINVTNKIAKFLRILGKKGDDDVIDRMLDENLLPRLFELLSHSEIKVKENTFDVIYYIWRKRSERIAVDVENFDVFNVTLNYIRNHGYRLTSQNLLIKIGERFEKYHDQFLNGGLMPILMRAYAESGHVTNWSPLSSNFLFQVDNDKFNNMKANLQSKDSNILLDTLYEFCLFSHKKGFDNKLPAELIIESNLLSYFIEYMQHEVKFVKDNASAVISQIADTNKKCGDILIKSKIMTVINKVISNYSNESWPTVIYSLKIVKSIMEHNRKQKIAVIQSGFLPHLFKNLEYDLGKSTDNLSKEIFRDFCIKPFSAAYTKVMPPVIEWLTKTVKVWVEDVEMCECVDTLTLPAYKSIHDPLMAPEVVKEIIDELRPNKKGEGIYFRRTSMPILHIFQNIISTTDRHRQVFFDCNPWPALAEFAQGSQGYNKEHACLCKLLSELLALDYGQFQKVIDSKLVGILSGYCIRSSTTTGRQGIIKMILDIISKSNEQQQRQIAGLNLFLALMLTLTESNDDVAELVTRGLCAVLRVGDNFAREPHSRQALWKSLKPKVRKRLGELVEHKDKNVVKMANEIMVQCIDM